jgi:hypothetical protein
MKALPKALAPMPRLHKTERNIPQITSTQKSVKSDETIVLITAIEAPEVDVMDASDTKFGLQKKGHIEHKYKPIQGARSSAIADMIDPFAEPLN